MINWIDAEDQFEAFFAKKKAFLYAFEDTREAQKTGGSRRIWTKARPSDYLATVNGVTFFAEVKSTSNKTAFPFSMIKPFQWECAISTTMVGGIYLFFIRSEMTKIWYKVPASFMIESLNNNRKSLKWEELAPYVYQPPAVDGPPPAP